MHGKELPWFDIGELYCTDFSPIPTCVLNIVHKRNYIDLGGGDHTRNLIQLVPFLTSLLHRLEEIQARATAT